METHEDPYQSFSMDSEFNSFDLNSCNVHLVSDGTSVYDVPIPRHKAHLIPAEIFSEIFLYTVQVYPISQRALMLVCRHWRAIMLSTPGIRFYLGIYSWTRKKYVETLGRKWHLNVIVDAEYVPDNMGAEFAPDVNPGEFHACLMAAAEAASRWRSLSILSLPHQVEYKDLQIKYPLQHPESFKYLALFHLATSCDLGNFLEPLLKAIITTVTPRFTVMEVFRPDAALYIVQYARFQIFSSLTTLGLICRRMQNPVDILPFLHRLETFEAHHLFLPIYPPGVDLPLTQTLRNLRLKSVSIQWMAGRMFPALKECYIRFPHHADAIQSVHMPSCEALQYDSNDLSALERFHISTLAMLEIKCGQWRTWSGDQQLIHLHPIFAAQSLIFLDLEIKCSEPLLTYMLRLVPHLEELLMRLSSPRVLSTAFFLALAAGGGRRANAGPSSQTIIPLGRKLRLLHLHYKRWLRGPERRALIPAFGAVVASHPPEDAFRFHLRLYEGSKMQEWYIRAPAERFDIEYRNREITIGVPSPDGIVHLSTPDDLHDRELFRPRAESGCIQLPRETEYILFCSWFAVPNDFLFSFHCLIEVRVPYLNLRMKQEPQFSLNAPLFHTLEVLHVETISSSFFAGQTFHKLERYQEVRIYEGDIPGLGPLTEMPVCTRLIVSVLRLATLKLPQIQELGLSFDAEHDHIWEKQIAVNTNLSGLKLLHLRHLRHTDPTWPTIAVIKILRSCPALETLIISDRFLSVPFVHFFEAFVPMNVPGSSALNQISGVLCPRLESLHIEDIYPTQLEELMHVLNDFVTQRAIIGSPLKSFTYYSYGVPKGPQKWQLIGRDKSFMMEEIVPARRFEIEI